MLAPHSAQIDLIINLPFFDLVIFSEFGIKFVNFLCLAQYDFIYNIIIDKLN